jgi:hypothetical protein
MDADVPTSKRRSLKIDGPRTVVAISTVLASWLLMQVVHECGHVLGALLTGGQVLRVVLVPWEFSRTDLLTSPHPLIECWMGPIVGVVAPVVLWLIAERFWSATAFWFRFFAGFCLIANGAYIAVGAFTGFGDGGDLMHDGCPAWALWLFGSVCTPIGLFLWHRLGKQFGFGPDAKRISARKAAISTLPLVAVTFVESIFAVLTAK